MSLHIFKESNALEHHEIVEKLPVPISRKAGSAGQRHRDFAGRILDKNPKKTPTGFLYIPSTAPKAEKCLDWNIFRNKRVILLPRGMLLENSACSFVCLCPWKNPSALQALGLSGIILLCVKWKTQINIYWAPPCPMSDISVHIPVLYLIFLCPSQSCVWYFCAHSSPISDGFVHFPILYLIFLCTSYSCVWYFCALPNPVSDISVHIPVLYLIFLCTSQSYIWYFCAHPSPVSEIFVPIPAPCLAPKKRI